MPGVWGRMTRLNAICDSHSTPAASSSIRVQPRAEIIRGSPSPDLAVPLRGLQPVGQDTNRGGGGVSQPEIMCRGVQVSADISGRHDVAEFLQWFPATR